MPEWSTDGVVFRRPETISDLLIDPQQAHRGQMFCYFNQAGYLTAALGGASLAEELDIKMNEPFQILFR